MNSLIYGCGQTTLQRTRVQLYFKMSKRKAKSQEFIDDSDDPDDTGVRPLF